MKKELPRISIVIPSYNQGNYIGKTLRSVVEQDYPNLQLIVMDGGSTDRTVDIIREYQGAIDLWVSEPDKGQTDAINKGFSACDGEIFNWLNTDDWLEQGRSEERR